MSNTYRVTMADVVNGEQFAFAIIYPAANANEAGKLAMVEWDNLPIIETRQVV